MSAQVVFDCDDLKKEIFSFCLPQYPVITKKMIDDRLLESKIKPDFILQKRKYPVIAIHCLLQELKYETKEFRQNMEHFRALPPSIVHTWLLKPSALECVHDKYYNKDWYGKRFNLSDFYEYDGMYFKTLPNPVLLVAPR